MIFSPLPTRPIQNARMHPQLINMLFKDKNEVFRNFNDIVKIHLLDHISINLISPSNEISIVSYTPSLEFNLLSRGLWIFDHTYFPQQYNDCVMIWWQDAFASSRQHELVHTKFNEHGFTYGFNLIRKIDKFNIVYSFATRSKNEMYDYYEEKLPELISIGDYGYKVIANIFSRYSSIIPIIKMQPKINLTRKFKIITNK